MSIRWLVPNASAICRKLTPLSPCRAENSTASSRSVALVTDVGGCVSAVMYQMVRVPFGTSGESRTMGKKHEIDERAWSAAVPDTVYRLLAEGSTWPVWSPIDSFELQEEGRGAREGLDAVRI